MHSPSSIARTLIRDFEGKRGYILVPVTVPDQVLGKRADLRGFCESLREGWRQDGFVRAMVDGQEVRLDDPLPLGKGKGYRPELFLVVDRVAFKDRGRLVEDGAPAELIAQNGAFAEMVRASRSRSATNLVAAANS